VSSHVVGRNDSFEPIRCCASLLPLPPLTAASQLPAKEFRRPSASIAASVALDFSSSPLFADFFLYRPI